MRKKYEKFTVIAAVLALIAVILSLYGSNYYGSQIDNIQTKHNEETHKYIVEYEQYNSLLEKKMVFHCITKDDGSLLENITISMSTEGLNDQCGFGNIVNNTAKKCLGVYTYGENITGSEIAQLETEWIAKTPPVAPDLGNLQYKERIAFWSSIIFTVLALLFDIAAFIFGFKHDRQTHSETEPQSKE